MKENKKYTDNRESCVITTPSSCVPYVGYISDRNKEEFKCKPNINDILEVLQNEDDSIREYLGDNSKIKLKSFKDKLETPFSQQELNQIFINILDDLNPDSSKDIDNYKLSIDLKCLVSQGCEPKQEYTILEIFENIVTGYCDLKSRVKTIEDFLNI